MRPLLINDEIREQIRAVMIQAEAQKLTLEQVRKGAKYVPQGQDHLDLKDRIDPDTGQEVRTVRPPSAHVLIPFGYRAAYSIELQPAGRCRHLSVSVDTKGVLPSVEAVELIAAEFGFTGFDMTWTEEFDPGHSAVNVVELCRPV